MSKPSCVPLVAACLFSVLVSGCKSTPTVTNPRPVVVRDFAWTEGRPPADSGLLAGRQGPAQRVLNRLHPEEAPVEKATRLTALLSETIVQELMQAGIPARRGESGAALPAEALLVHGQFLEVDEGNRLRRAVVGFGAGASEILVEVSVFDLARSAQQPVVTFGTGTGSKPLPGAIITMNPYVMAAKFVLSRNATDKDVKKLGKNIARHLAEIEVQHPAHP